MSIINRQVVNVAEDLSSGGLNAKVTINVSFTPDEVILRQFVYAVAAPPGTGVFQIATNLINDQILCVFSDALTSVTPNTHFLMNKGANGSWNFQVQDMVAGGGPGPVSSTPTGKYQLMLEFIEYEKE